MEFEPNENEKPFNGLFFKALDKNVQNPGTVLVHLKDVEEKAAPIRRSV